VSQLQQQCAVCSCSVLCACDIQMGTGDGGVVSQLQQQCAVCSCSVLCACDIQMGTGDGGGGE